MPYANIFLLNLVQAIIAVFLSSEFIKRDRKQDTTEVFYVRSMSNGTYLLGKTWSILSIFLLINAVALLMGVIFNLLAMDTSVDWQAYLYYPAIISIPTLLFIIGLSCLLMSIIRNQALTFVILIGYILSSLIYLKSTHYYLYDYMAFYLPLFHSEIIGFGDWQTILRLRGMYAGLGLGFIFISILFIKRLPQSKMMNAFALVSGISCIAFAVFLGKQHWEAYQYSLELPARMVSLNNQHLQHARIDIESHEIKFEQGTDQFTAFSQIKGKAEVEAKKFVFNLNPGLDVSSVTSGGKALAFQRDLHLLFVESDSILLTGTPIEWIIHYHGNIDEFACYPDIDPKLKFKKPDEYLFDIGRRYAFIHPEYLLLTPEAQWYPQAGCGYSDQDASWFRKDFIQYKLTVKTLPGLKPISVGESKKAEKDTYYFEADFAQPYLSLAIGKYHKKSLGADSLDFSVYYLEGHDYFKNALPDIRDTLPSIIRERLGDFERRSDLKYPFKEFAIVEVPGQFKSYDRTWTSVHQTIQPGMVFFPEKGLFSRNMDFNGSVKRRKRWRQNRNRTPEALQMTVFNNFLHEFFRFKNVRTSSNNQRTIVEETINPYYQFVQFYEMCNNLDSKDWPFINRVFESYLRGGINTESRWARRSSGSTQNELANMVLQEKPFAEIITMTENRELIDNVIDLKGKMLFSLIQARVETSEFRRLIVQLLEETRFTNLSFNDFEDHLRKEFGVDLSNHMSSWFHDIKMPRYMIGTPIAEKVLAGNREVTRIRFRISNLGTTPGVVQSVIRTEEAVEKLLFLESGQSKEVHYLSITEPSGIRFNTLASGNLPNQIEYTFEQINKTSVSNAQEKEIVVDNPILLVNDKEIIVDNENPSFEFSHYEETSRLRKWLKVNAEEGFKYQGTRVWRPPFNWTATTNDQFYGDFVRSAFYIKAGDGSKEAKWKIPVTEPGRYDVYYHIYKDESFNWNRSQKGSYKFTIPHENGIDQPTININKQTPGGWTSLGDYAFRSDTIMITLNNESNLRAIFADAIKLVRLD